MSDSDDLERHLRRAAHDSLDERADEVDVDAELTGLQARLADRATVTPPQSGGHDRVRWFAIAAAAVILVSGIVAIAWPRDATAPVAPPPDSSEPTPSSSLAAVPPNTDRTTPDTTTSTTTGTTVGAPEPVPETTVAMAPATTEAELEQPLEQPDACTSEPHPPPNLVDGSPPGDATIEPLENGRLARWGSTESSNAVSQFLPAEPDPSLLDLAIADGRAVAAGAYEAAAIPVGDPPVSVIMIQLRDTDADCLREYSVGPGLHLDKAEALVQRWVDALAGGIMPEPDPGDAGTEYFGRRTTDDPPYFAIDRFAPDGSEMGTLSDDEVAAMIPNTTLPDGSVITLEGERPDAGRCGNQTLIRSDSGSSGPLHPDLDRANSFRVTVDGVVIAARDVCPDGARWGDPGTRWELVALDVDDPSTDVEVLLTRESDPSEIVFENDEFVVAPGWMNVRELSPDGRYVPLADWFHIEQSRFHVLDRERPGDVLAIESSCDVAGEIVGPPRFVGEGVVVVARRCATEPVDDPSADGPIGSGPVRVEAVDLTATSPDDAIIWSGSEPRLGVDSYTQTVELQARLADDGTVWAIVTGGGGIERSSRTYVLHTDDSTNITRPGYTFAFDPADLAYP